VDFLPCRYSLRFLVDREDRIFSYFLRCQSLFISRGVDDVEEHPSLSGAREGEVCMKYKDHHTRHPRGHLGDRASAQGARGCAWRDDQFGRGQNPVLGWSDPTFAHGSVAKVMLGVAPAHEEIPSDVLPACVAEFLDETCEGKG